MTGSSTPNTRVPKLVK